MGEMAWMTPLAVAVAAGLGVAAVAWARPGAREGWPLWPWVLGAAVGAVALGGLSAAGLGPAQWVGAGSLLRALGASLLLCAAALAFFSTRGRAQAELALSCAPQPLDQAAGVVRATGKPLQGVFRGRISSDQAVTSPSGVVCAFYQAELRAPAGGGQKGPLLGAEQGLGTTLWLRGERALAAVSFSPAQLQSQEEVRRCTLFAAQAGGGGLVEGEGPVEVLSFERLGRLGEGCVVVGELRCGPVAGSWELRGAGGGPAKVVVGHDASALGKRARARAWSGIGAAASLCVAAAWCLARSG